MTDPNVRVPDEALYAEAIKVLEERGWIRGSYERVTGHCLVGAMYEAEDRLIGQRGGRGWYGQMTVALRHKYELKIDPEAWNDEYASGKEEVIEFLRFMKGGEWSETEE